VRLFAVDQHPRRTRESVKWTAQALAVSSGVDAALRIRVWLGNRKGSAASVTAEVLRQPREDMIERGTGIMDELAGVQADLHRHRLLGDEPRDDDW
jgi:hypothetical protein